MNQVTSFQVDHDKLTPGMYTSRIDGDVVTYDIRMVHPNQGPYLENDQIHTFEHLFATCVRGGPYSQQIVYIGPMGCRTGFHLLTRDGLTQEEAIRLVQDALDFVASYEGEIPGTASTKECGNVAEHHLPKAKALARQMQAVLKDWTPGQLTYKE